MNPVVKYLGFAVIAYVFSWILYMIFAYSKIYYDKHGFKYLLSFFHRV